MFRRNRMGAWLLLVAFVVAGTAALAFTGSSEEDRETLRELRILFDVVGLMQSQYLWDVSAVDLISAYVRTGSINEMLSEVALDRYTRFVDPTAYRRMTEMHQGAFGGIGIVVGTRDGRLVIASPIEGTPAVEVGLQAGDHIVAIDGRPTKNLTQDEAVSLMRGEVGTEVVLTIERTVDGESQILEFRIIRAAIETPSIVEPVVILPDERFEFLEDPVGYLALTSFTRRSDEEMVEAVRRLLDEYGVKGLVIDLRQNPGGTFDTAIRMANRFIREGPLLHVDYQTRTDSYHANPDLWLGETPPIVILVDFATASSAEIFASALQDRGVAVVVGETTVGKGLIQSVIPLRQGEDGALVLTTARYRTAGGHEIDDVGVQPDILVPWEIEDRVAFYREAEYDPELGIFPDDPQLRRALEVLQQLIDRRETENLSPAA